MTPENLTALRNSIRRLLSEAADLRVHADRHADTDLIRASDLELAGRCETAAAGQKMEYVAGFTDQPMPRCPKCCAEVNATISDAIPIAETPYLYSLMCPACMATFVAYPIIAVAWTVKDAAHGL
jgi:hypothetical protein